MKKILIIDDSALMRTVLSDIINADSRFQVVDKAKDGVEGLELLKKNTYDAVVLDINMPRMDGTQLLQNVRRLDEYKKVPVVIVSGVYDKDQEKQFLKDGAQKFIVKSDFERSNLLNSVKELLDGNNR